MMQKANRIVKETIRHLETDIKDAKIGIYRDEREIKRLKSIRK